MLQWLWFGLACCALLVMAYLTRFTPMPAEAEGGPRVWDRWKRQVCVATAKRPDGPSVICSLDDAIGKR
jgi:hypothetical protein